MVVEFDAVIEINGVNPFVAVTQERAGLLRQGWRRPMPVLVRVNGVPADPWKINMMPRGDGDFYLYLHETIRKASATAVGDTVRVTAAFDDTYVNGPQHPIPNAFATALAESAAANRNWEALPPSRQKEVLRMFAGLKSDDAFDRNLNKALFVLNGNDGHFMGRDWRGGR